MTRLTLMTSCALVAIATAPAVAEEVYDLGEITVTANQGETVLERSGTTVEIVDEAEILAEPGNRLSDVLTGLPGVTASSNGGLGTSTNLRIRGLGGAYVPVLLDGIDISDPASSGSGFDWGGTTASNISRIEVLKGSQSARFGINAVGGVVSLQSWTPTKDGVSGQATVEYGTYNTRRAGFSLGLRTERTELSIGLSSVTTDGFSANAAGTEDDGYEETTVNLRAVYHLSDTALIGLTGFYRDAEGEFDEWSGDGALPYDEINTREAKGVRLFSEFMTGNVSHALAYSYFETDRVSSSNGFDTPFDGDRKKLEYKASFDLGSMLTMHLGADNTREEASGVSAEVTGVFAEAVYTPTDAVDIVASVRHEDLSDFDNKTTGRIALAWRIQDDLILRAQAATGYKPPSLYQLTSAYGDTTFQPEESTSFELGLEKRLGGSDFIRATLFQTDIDGQVYWDYGSTRCGSGFGCYEVQDFTAKGLELSGQIALNDRVDLVASYTLTDTSDGTGAQALRVPRHDLEVGVNAELGSKTTGGISVNHVADRMDTVGAVPDYTVVNAHVAYQINDNTQAYLRVVNLTDEDYETAAGYSTSGRAFYFGLRASF
ncbi:TonB-dependent receptor plug domain-containing protein [Thalassovita sp.]|uniref:TonB-dependent receptor plug domain-containing protein n=1 Tax=Thalassovita sp. TaxID=1979401 RepID=UPI002880DEF9|nr:TonB-dependent receptor [Thalassovita sp.]MDF1803426.1 TonB-dependent receptor [Thalassovita sp.]